MNAALVAIEQLIFQVPGQILELATPRRLGWNTPRVVRAVFLQSKGVEIFTHIV